MPDQKEQHIPLEKQGKKARQAYFKSHRAGWGGLNPVTRKPPNPKIYNRKKRRREENPEDGAFLLFTVLSEPAIPA